MKRLIAVVSHVAVDGVLLVPKGSSASRRRELCASPEKTDSTAFAPLTWVSRQWLTHTAVYWYDAKGLTLRNVAIGFDLGLLAIQL